MIRKSWIKPQSQASWLNHGPDESGKSAPVPGRVIDINSENDR